MNPLKTIGGAVAIASVFALGGCASPGVMRSSALNYNTAQAQQMQSVQLGTVVSILPVNIAPRTTGVGTIGGAAAGEIIGASIGHGTGSALLGIAGAIAGGIAGSAAEGHALAQPGYQITVRLDNSGAVVAVTQAADIAMAVGERVELIGGYYGTPARVLPISQ